WNGTDWLLRASAALPGPREGLAVTYDTAEQTLLLFGGRTSAGPLADTWRWTGADWRQVVTANVPPARSDHALAFDRARARGVLFGGVVSGNTLANDTWEWNGS